MVCDVQLPGLQARLWQQEHQVASADQLAVHAAGQADKQHQRLALGFGCLGDVGQ